jgi:hypothetical protein
MRRKQWHQHTHKKKQEVKNMRLEEVEYQLLANKEESTNAERTY